MDVTKDKKRKMKMLIVNMRVNAVNVLLKIVKTMTLRQTIGN
jgi:hypothetical protein